MADLVGKQDPGNRSDNVSTYHLRRFAIVDLEGVHLMADLAPIKWIRVALIAATGAALAVLAFRFHPVGDFFTESDFYANYASGARALQHGHFEAARYAIHGPAYELMLAGMGTAAGDLFTAARLISVVSAVVVLVSAWWLARRRLDETTAAWLVALIALNPVFVRYGYSASADMMSFAFFSIAVAALLGARDRDSVALSGFAAGLAALTRYNLLSFLPAAIVVLLARLPRSPTASVAPSPGAAARFRHAALFTSIFIVAWLPFVVLGARSNSLPGAGLFKDAGLYLGDTPAATIEALYGPGSAPTARPAPVGAAALATRLGTGIVTHLRDDAMVLVGWPAAALALVSLAWLISMRASRSLLAIAPIFAFVFLALAPIYYSDRYSMTLLPFYLAPAAIVLGLFTTGGGRRRLLAFAAGGLVLLATARQSIALQRLEYQSLPIETLTSGRAIRAVASPGERVLARKAHIAYESGLDFVVFPDLKGLPELAEFCRSEHVGYLYYSWYEIRLRPQFGFLLDTMATVPGLAPLFATANKPSATYRVGPEFGAMPPWWADPTRREEIQQHVNALLAPSLR